MNKLNFLKQKYFPKKSNNLIKEQIKTKNDICIITLFENKWKLYLLSTGEKVSESKEYSFVSDKVSQIKKGRV